MEKQVRLQTDWGPVTITLSQCDAPGCTSCVQEDFMVGWHRLEPLGVEIAAFGQLPGPLDFCSLTCLVNSVGLISGKP